MKVRVFFTVVFIGILGTSFQLDCSLTDQEITIIDLSLIDQEFTKKTLLNDYREFKAYLEKLRGEINLLHTAQSIVSYVPFGSKFLDNKVKKEAEKRGYDEFSQRLIPIGELFFQEDWESVLKTTFFKPSTNELCYLNLCKNKIKEDFGTNWQTGSFALNRSIRIMHELHVNHLVLEDKPEKRERLYQNALKKGKCAFYNFLVRYKEKHEKLPTYVLLNIYLSYWFEKNGLIIQAKN